MAWGLGNELGRKGKTMKYKWNHTLNLQLFAEDPGNGGGADGGNGGGSGGEPMSFDDFLKGEGNQAEFDRRVQKAVDRKSVV